MCNKIIQGKEYRDGNNELVVVSKNHDEAIVHYKDAENLVTIPTDRFKDQMEAIR